jgi:hypothetical protein
MTTDTDTRETLQQFIDRIGIRMTASQTDRNPHMEGADNMDHWRCNLRCNGRRIAITFSMGAGHNGREPQLAEVLDCIASDASGVENARSFDDWCSEYGYDTDSRKAERIYATCTRQTASLKRLLGDDAAYEALLWNTERL